MYVLVDVPPVKLMLLVDFVTSISCRAWFNLLTLVADGCILSYYWCLIIHRWLYCLLDVIDDR